MKLTLKINESFLFMGLKSSFIFFLFLSLLANESFGQGETVGRKTVHQKVYVSLDKQFYSVEEDIHFKIYELNSHYNPSTSSGNVVTIALIDEDKKVVSSLPVLLKKGTGSGKINISDTLNGETYYVIAYNEFGKQDSRFVCFKQIEIINFFQSPAHRKLDSAMSFKEQGFKLNPSESKDIKIDFYPVGGKLVKNLRSSLAFRIYDAFDKGVTAKANIKDTNGNIVSAISSNDYGLGSFNFTPQPQTKYFASIAINDSTTKDFQLPAAEPVGATMILIDSLEDFLIVGIESNYPSNPSFRIVASSAENQILFSSPVTSANKGARIHKDNLRRGLIKLSLLNVSGEVEAEQFYYAHTSPDNISIEINPAKDSYFPREKVELEIDLQAHNLPLDSTSLSISVFDANQYFNDKNFGNINNYLGLLGGLRVHSDPVLFEKIAASVMTGKEINLLLSMVEVHDYEQKSIDIKKPEGLSLFGKVVDSNGNPSAYASLIASIPDKNEAFLYVPADGEGNFEIPLEIEGRKKIVLSAIGASNPKEVLTIKPTIKELSLGNLNLSSATNYEELEKYFRKKEQLIRIEEAYKVLKSDTLALRTEKKRQKNELELSANTFIELEKYQSFSTMEEVIQEIVPGFKFKKSKSGLEIRLLNLANKLYYQQEPLYFIDNVHVLDLSAVLELDPSMVENVVVIGDPHNLRDFGPLAGNGIFAIHTYHRNYTPLKLKNSVSLMFQGFNEESEEFTFLPTSDFSSPSFPSLLYWNPDVTTDKMGKAKVSFYNSDAVGAMRVIVEGLTKNGEPFYKTFAYQVKLSQ